MTFESLVPDLQTYLLRAALGLASGIAFWLGSKSGNSFQATLAALLNNRVLRPNMTCHFSCTKSLLAVALLILLLPMQSHAKDFWWPYLAAYDAGPGSTRVNLELKKRVPFSDFPNLVVTGTTYATTRSDGLPDQAGLDRLNVLSEKVIAAIRTASPSIYAGTFTHNREQLHYVYVKNITGIEEILGELYAKACAGCKIYTNIKKDPAWSAYRDFLYPNPATLDFYRDELKKIGFIAQ